MTNPAPTERTKLLAGLGLALHAEGPEADWAEWFLHGLGGHTEHRHGGASLDGPAAPPLDVPPGTLELAGGYLLAGAALAAWLTGDEIEIERWDVARQVAAAAVLGVFTATASAARPPQPLAWAGGALCADLGAGDDADAFARLVEVVGVAAPGAETMAARAQEWRLAVTPYRLRRQQAGVHPLRLVAPHMGHAEPADPTRELGTVVDLTVMWSGPLCTALLACVGLRVVKIEPECRPDGLRHSPGGHLHRLLNADKRHEPLDLRRAEHQLALRDLVADADLVIDNFSPRVGPNLGIGRADLCRHNPSLLTLSMPAFPPGPQRHWVSYGTGVHAALGLGDDGRAGWHAPAFAYPDPLAGFAAFASALALLVARRLGRGAHGGEVALASASQPLLVGPRRPWAEPAESAASITALARGWTPSLPLRLTSRAAGHG